MLIDILSMMMIYGSHVYMIYSSMVYDDKCYRLLMWHSLHGHDMDKQWFITLHLHGISHHMGVCLVVVNTTLGGRQKAWASWAEGLAKPHDCMISWVGVSKKELDDPLGERPDDWIRTPLV